MMKIENPSVTLADEARNGVEEGDGCLWQSCITNPLGFHFGMVVRNPLT